MMDNEHFSNAEHYAPLKNYTATPAEYARGLGTACPVCGDSDLDCGALESDEGIITQDVKCTQCGATWVDIYKLVRYVHLDSTVLPYFKNKRYYKDGITLLLKEPIHVARYSE